MTVKSNRCDRKEEKNIGVHRYPVTPKRPGEKECKFRLYKLVRTDKDGR